REKCPSKASPHTRQVCTGPPTATAWSWRWRCRWCWRWSGCTTAAHEVETTDACVPVKAARVSVVFTYGPEGHTIGIDGGIAIIDLAVVRDGRAAHGGCKRR